MTIVKIESKIKWNCSRAKGGNWVADCNPLGLTIQSETWVTLMDDIAHTLNAMFRDLLKSQELSRFLRDRGWRSIGRMPSKPTNVWFDVPFLTTPANRDPQIALH